jgi:hypothetical protein
MSGAPFDILRHFDAEDGEVELHEVFVQGAQPDPGGWIEISGARRALDSTVLVLLHQHGARKIAVKHEDRVVEFDLDAVIVRSGPLTAVERPATNTGSET